MSRRQLVLSDKEARYLIRQLAADPTAPPPTAHAASQDSAWVRTLVQQCANVGLPPPLCYPAEYTFTGCGVSGARRWKLDLAWVPERICCEVEGGLYNKGRHVRPAGYEKDVIKYTELGLAGWLLVRATPPMVRDGRALRYLEAAFAVRRPDASEQ